MFSRGLPQPHSAQVWLDFDGTVSRQDLLDELINRYAVDDSWKAIEERWQAGLIGSRECLAGEFALVRISDADLEGFIQTIELDPGIHPLLNLLARLQIPVAILSDGIEPFIRQVLRRHGIEHLPIRANTIRRHGLEIEMLCPHSNPQCEAQAAHCKCASADLLRQPGRQTIYVGDGRSDLCPARKADLVFAKSVLARRLSQENRPFIPYENLQQIAERLQEAWL